MYSKQSIKKTDVKYKNRFYNIRIFLLLAFVASLPYEYWDPIGIRASFTISKLFGLLYALAASLEIKNILKIISKNKSLVYSAFLLWFWIFLVTIFNTTIYYNNNPFAFPILQVVVLFILVFYEIENNQQVKSKIYFIFILSIFSVALLLSAGIGIQSSSGLNMESIETSRVYFMGMNPNTLGAMASITVILALSLIFEKSFGKWRYLFLLTTPNLLMLVGISGSRGAFFTLLAGVFVFFLFKERFSFKKLSYLLIGGVIAYLMIDYLAEFEKLQDRLLETIETGATGGRFEIWSHAFEVFSKKPLTGFGLHGMQIELGRQTIFNTSHNVFIDFALMGGIIGFMLYINIIRIIFKQSVLSLKNNSTTNIALFVIILFLLLKSGGGYTSKMIWLMLATIAPVNVKCLNKAK